MDRLIFLKLGGSLLTDKTRPEKLRSDVLSRVAGEIAASRRQNPGLKLVLGHGSGSFGHVAAAKHGTRLGVSGSDQWAGFCEVSDAAARLNRTVTGVLLAAGVPAVSIQPSSSAVCEDGRLVRLAIAPIEMALKAGLVPVVYGDVAFDTVRGGTIISTEEVMDFVAIQLNPSYLLLAGETPGVLDPTGNVIRRISPATLSEVLPALGGSRGTDVTGGMVAKVEAMLSLCGALPNLTVRIFSGLEPHLLETVLSAPDRPVGTELAGS